MILDAKLDAGDLIVLDGAIGSEIDRLGGRMDDAAWCGVANVTHPGTVQRVHESYLEAGADVITANTFATCRHVLEGAGYGGQTVAINRRAVQLAQQARDRVAPDRPVAIAGSMSNNVAWLPGTVVPDPDYLPTPEEESANYREMAETLAEAGCDLLIMEMAYPEATGVDAVSRVARGVDPVDFAEHCRSWVESGVQIIGGCCGTTIHHIRAMVDRLPVRPGKRPEVVQHR